MCIARFSCNLGDADQDFETDVLYAKTGRKALRVIPRGKHRLTVYRAHQVFMKSFFLFMKMHNKLSGSL